MRITESRLRSLIRSVIRESVEDTTIDDEADAIIKKYKGITEDNIDKMLVMHDYISNEIEGNFEAELKVRNKVIETYQLNLLILKHLINHYTQLPLLFEEF